MEILVQTNLDGCTKACTWIYTEVTLKQVDLCLAYSKRALQKKKSMCHPVLQIRSLVVVPAFHILCRYANLARYLLYRLDLDIILFHFMALLFCGATVPST